MEASSAAEFLKAAQATPKSMGPDTLETGETGWIHGQPVTADKGKVAVRNRAGVTTTVLEDDVLEFAKDGTEFYLKVPAGVKVQTRLDRVSTLTGRRPKDGCSCSEDDPKAAGGHRARRTGLSPSRPSVSLDMDDFCIVCTWVYEEHWCKLNGYLIKCYEPVLDCEWVCTEA